MSALWTNEAPRTLALAARFRELVAELTGQGRDIEARKLRELSERLELCGHGVKRCGSRACPVCQVKVALRQTRRFERDLRRLKIPKERALALRLSVATDSPKCGHEVLTEGLLALRRRIFWREAIAGGAYHVEHKLSEPGAAFRWNIHAHEFVALHEGKKLDPAQLDGAWAEHLARAQLAGHGPKSSDHRTADHRTAHALTGSVYVEPVRRLWAWKRGRR